jgi:hypothetical protein
VPKGGKAVRLPPTTAGVQEMIRVALKTKAPKVYHQLKANGQLSKFLEEGSAQMEEAQESLGFQAMMKAKEQAQKEGKNPIEEAALINLALHQVDEAIMGTFLEFSDPPTTAAYQKDTSTYSLRIGEIAPEPFWPRTGEDGSKITQAKEGWLCLANYYSDITHEEENYFTFNKIIAKYYLDNSYSFFISVRLGQS